ncbi:MAG: 50S ribosomal protein L21 [Planctomycetota bacterium]
MFAIIEDSGTQIKVSEGDVIDIDRRELGDEDIALTFDRVVYLSSDDDKAPTIGAPYVDGAKVEADILEEGRTPKVDVVKFKRRKGYHRKRGHRQDFIRVRVTSISS